MTKTDIDRRIWRKQNIRILGIANKEPTKSTRQVLTGTKKETAQRQPRT